MVNIKLNLVYLGILVHTQCKIVHTLNSCLGRTYYSVISFFFATKSSATKTPHLNYLNYINYLPNYLPKEPPGPSTGPPTPHPTLNIYLPRGKERREPTLNFCFLVRVNLVCILSADSTAVYTDMHTAVPGYSCTAVRY